MAEDGSDGLVEELAGAELLSSVLLVLETRRTLIRLARDRVLSADEYAACVDRFDEDRELFVLRDLTLDLCESNLVPAIATPRSLDLAHLRTALWFQAGEPINRFVTMDRAQRDAARQLGLPA